MLFCTHAYILFFIVSLITMRVLERTPKLQSLFLLLTSNFFYGYWDTRFLLLIWASTAIDFTCGLLIEKSKNDLHNKLLLTLSVITNLGLLATFKYFDFFQARIANILSLFHINFNPHLLSLVLPVGISFYTFQTLSYTIDVYRKKIPACHSLLVFAQYVCYFPQLVAGPIERAAHLIPQLETVKKVRTERILSGCLLILWGSFKKAVIADIAGIYLVDPLFPDPGNALNLILATAAFSVQIYCDFSGYCDIARGSSRCMGIELVDNFDAPYFAANIQDFWRRWHISLSSWLRDYLYIPLGGNRKGTVRTYLNLSITMLLCGLWHGANMTFVIWGAYNGALLIIHRLLFHTKEKEKDNGIFRRILKILGTNILVLFGWLIFRMESIRQLPFYLNLLVSGWTFDEPVRYYAARVLTVLLLISGVIAVHIIQRKSNRENMELEDLFSKRPVFTGVCFGCMAIVIAALGTFARTAPFIYFQF